MDAAADPPKLRSARIIAAEAAEAAAAAGRGWAIKMVADGTVQRLRDSDEQATAGDWQGDDGPRWSGWVKCPCCHDLIFVVMASNPTQIWLNAPEEAPPAARTTAPPYLQRFLDALAAQEPWAVAVAENRGPYREPAPATPATAAPTEAPAAPPAAPTAAAGAAPARRRRFRL